MFIFIQLVTDINNSFLDKKHLIYIVKLLKKNLIRLKLSGLQISQYIHHKWSVVHIFPSKSEFALLWGIFQIECGFENGEEVLEIELRVDFVLDSVR